MSLRATLPHALAGAGLAWLAFASCELLPALAVGFYPPGVLAAYLAVYAAGGLVTGCLLWAESSATGPGLRLTRHGHVAMGLASVAGAALLYSSFEEQVVAGGLLEYAIALLLSAAAFAAASRALGRTSPGTQRRAAGLGLVLVPALLLVLFAGRLAARDGIAADLAPAGPAAGLAALAALFGIAHARARSALALAGVPALAVPVVLFGANAWSARRHEPLAAAPPEQAAPAPAGAPNLIVIVLDTLRRDHVGVHGYERDTTPELDAFARDALVFEQARSTSSWTLPAHASLFTGTFPYRHDAHSGSRNPAPGLPFGPIDASLPTLAEVLARHGYQTGAVVANFGAASSAWGLGRGFERYDDRPRMQAPSVRPFAEFVRARLAARAWPHVFEPRYRPAEEITTLALEWIAARRGDPFFLFLNYLDVHAPYLPRPPFARFGAFDPGFRDPHLAVNRGERDLTSAERRYLVSTYDAELRYLDHWLGELFDGLRREGLFDDALVVVTSDHGEAFGEHGFLYHEKTLYEEEIAIPLVVRFPGGRPAGRSDRRVQILDVMPTLLERVGIPVPSQVQGASLLGGERASLAELHPSELWLETYGDRFDRTLRAVIAPGDGAKVILSSRGDDELYWIDRDPGETHDRAREERERIAARRRELAGAIAAAPAAGGGDVPELDPSLRTRLRSLGYLP